MHWETLQALARRKPVRALVIGAGEYGFSFVFQCRHTPGLAVVAIHARRVERGVAAFRHAGLPEDAIRVCGGLSEARAALQAGKVVVSDDALMLLELPLDI